ncbi:MAG TPA: DUF3617 family protein [Gallionella sp.]
MHLNRWSKAVALLCVTAFPCIAIADDLPALQQGMWEFSRTVEDSKAASKPLKMTNKICTDPTSDMKKMNEALTKQGCKFSPVVKTGNTYIFTSKCTIQGVPMKSRSVLSVESNSAYKVNVTSTAGARSTKEVLVARRLGNC